MKQNKTMIPSKTELVAKVSCHEYLNATMKADIIIVENCKRIPSLSVIPIWRVLAPPVIVWAADPDGSLSSSDIDCLNKARRYSSLMAAESRVPTNLKKYWEVSECN